MLVGAADIGAAAMGQPLGGDIDMGPMPIGPYMSLDELEGAVRSDLERAEAALTGRPGVAIRVEVGSLAPALEEAPATATDALLALDAPQEGRIVGIIDGDPATWLMHSSDAADPALARRRGPRRLPPRRGGRASTARRTRRWPPRRPARSPPGAAPSCAW